MPRTADHHRCRTPPHISSHIYRSICSGAKANVGVSDALALSPSHRASRVDGWL